MNLHLFHPTFLKGALVKGASKEPKYLAETASVWWWSQIRRCGLDAWSTSPERSRWLRQVHLITSNHTAAPFVCSKWLLSSKTSWRFSHARELTSNFQMQLLLGEEQSRTSAWWAAPNAWYSDEQGMKQESHTCTLSCHRKGFHRNPSAAPGHLVGMGTTALWDQPESSWIVLLSWVLGTGFMIPCWPREPEQVSAAVYGSVVRIKPCPNLASVTSWTDMSGTRSLMQYFNLLCHFTQMLMEHGRGRQAWCRICVHMLYLWNSLQRACHFQHTFSSVQQTCLFPFSCHYCLHARPGDPVPKCCRKDQVTQHDTGMPVLEIKEVTGSSFHQHGYNSTT